jgi:hypothetical protein
MSIDNPVARYALQFKPSCHSERSVAKSRNLWPRSSQLGQSSADALEEGTGVLAGSHPTSLKTRCVFRALGPSASLGMTAESEL